MPIHPTLAAGWYTDPLVYQNERQSIFENSWIHVGYRCDLTTSGGVLCEALAEHEIVVSQDVNLCLTAYEVLKDHSHKEILVESFRDLIFVSLNPKLCSLTQWLADFPTALTELNLESFAFHSRVVRRVACNWKTYADNFLEGYHVPTVHPGMARDADASNYSVILGDDPRWNVHVMPAREDSVFGMFGWLFPTFAFNVVPGGWAVERWLPRGADHIDLFFEYFFEPNAGDIERIVEMNEVVAQEDVRICEAVQRNLDSGIYSAGLLSPKWEEPLAVFHEMIREIATINEYAPTGT